MTARQHHRRRQRPPCLPRGRDIAGSAPLPPANNLIGKTDGSYRLDRLRPDRHRRRDRPVLAPLGNYGGPTQTMALLPGSPAIDAGSNALIPAASPPTSAASPHRRRHRRHRRFESQGYRHRGLRQPPATNATDGVRQLAVGHGQQRRSSRSTAVSWPVPAPGSAAFDCGPVRRRRPSIARRRRRRGDRRRHRRGLAPSTVGAIGSGGAAAPWPSFSLTNVAPVLVVASRPTDAQRLRRARPTCARRSPCANAIVGSNRSPSTRPSSPRPQTITLAAPSSS